MAPEREERKLVAILAADVVGYSRLMEADESGTLARLKALRAELIEPLIAEHRGRVVKLMGDGLLAEFVSVVDAVRCAVEVQQGIAERSHDPAQAEPIALRVGVNLGDVIVDGDDIYGDGVNVAARLEALAEPSGICVAGVVHDSIAGKLDVAFEDTGEQEVKNIARPIRVWRWRRGAPRVAAGIAASSGSPPLPDKPSIAVLPFDNMSGDPEQEYFADGITEDIITALSSVQSFFVIARNSTFIYKGQAVDLRRVASDLGVQYVMEGSVRKAGNKVRVTAQLIEAETARHVWAGRHDGTLDDIFDLQDEITASVVGAIEPQLLRAEAERIKQKRPESLDAYDHTLRGLSHMNKLTPEDSAEALRLFSKSIEIDPGYGRAYVCASWCYRRQVQVGGMILSEADRAESIRLAKEALKVAPDDPYVMWQAALTAAYLEQDFDGAIGLIDRSLSVNANANRAWIASGIVRTMVGDPETAMEHAERSIRLSPLDISKWVAHGVLATACLQEQRYEDAAGWAREAVRQQPYNAPAYHVLAASCAHLQRMDEAAEAIRRSLELDADLTIARLQAIYPIARYKNLDGFLDGLRQAGLPE